MTFSRAELDIKPVKKPIDQLVEKYLASDGEHDASLSGLLNWFSILPRDGSESAFELKGEEHLLDREKYVEVFKKKYDEAAQKDGETAGISMDAMWLGFANDFVAQLEAMANFRRLSVANHFAKSRYILVDWLGGRTNIRPILKLNTTTYLENAEAYITQHYDAAIRDKNS